MTGVHPVLQAGAFATALLAILALFVAIQKGVRWMLRTLRKLGDFLDDWNGEPDRPGVPGRLPVMERLSRIEGQLKPNGGKSARDVLDRIEASVVEQ